MEKRSGSTVRDLGQGLVKADRERADSDVVNDALEEIRSSRTFVGDLVAHRDAVLEEIGALHIHSEFAEGSISKDVRNLDDPSAVEIERIDDTVENVPQALVE